MPDKIKIMIDTAGQKGHGSFIYLEEGETVTVGRHTGSEQGMLEIYNLLVSKQHCRIAWTEEGLQVEDLGSKNGTELNGQRLNPHEPAVVSPGDRLTLVNGLVALELETVIDLEETREYVFSGWPEDDVRLNDDMQSVQIDEETVPLSKKEYQLFKLMHSRLDHFVTRDEIMRYVWPERCIDDTELVGIDEVNSLIYRTNKKLQGYFVIKSVYKKGVYMKREHQDADSAVSR
jgi:DNA-binding winged helix-turn-helix (wHTH) protein